MKNRLNSIRLMTATVVLAILNNIGLGSFGRVNAELVILSDRQEELISARRPDIGWTYLFTPDYLGQKIHVRVITPPKMPSIDWSYISTPNCNPNSVAATQRRLFVACNSEKGNGPDRILVYDTTFVNTNQFTLIKTITSSQFNRIISIAFDKNAYYGRDENLWVSSYGNNKIVRIPRSNLNSNNPEVDKALVNSPAEPVGITFAPDGSLWVASTYKGGLVVNIAAADLDRSGLDIDVNPRYCISKSDCNPVADAFDFPEGIAFLNGIIWVSNNGGDHPGYKMTALQVVQNQLTFQKTFGSAPGSPFSCPGGLFSDGTDLYINDQSYGLSSTGCGNGDEKASVNGVVRYLRGDLTGSPKLFRLTTSRPGFGGIAVLKIKVGNPFIPQ